ncbi:MAG: hypothetical protein PHW13_11930 [Methylococcales bacterium]|nr:hypothetical protein [Methylococcales bacterium]
MMASAVSAAVVQAGSQVPKSVAAVAGTALAPTLGDSLVKAAGAAAIGDWLNAVVYGLPALLGLLGAIIGVLTPNPVLGGATPSGLTE